METEYWLSAVNSLSVEEQNLFYGKTKPLNRLQFLAGRLLVRLLFGARSPEHTCSIKTDPFGKPFLAAHPQWGISIAHSHKIVACALNTSGPVGIDAEAIRPVDFAAFESLFLPQEWAHIRAQTDPMQAFFYLWVKKEAIAKADGRGLGMDFLSINAMDDVTPTQTQRWDTIPLDFGNGYGAALAYMPTPHPPTVQLQEINPLELLGQFHA